MRFITRSTYRAASAAALLCLIGYGKDRPEPGTSVLPGQEATLTVEVSAPDASIGEEVAVAIRQGAQLVGLEGKLMFDPERLAYLGQRAFDVVVAKDRSSPAGVLYVSAASCEPLERDAAILLFRVRAPNYTAGMAFHLDRASASERGEAAQAPVTRRTRTSARSSPCNTARTIPVTLK